MNTIQCKKGPGGKPSGKPGHKSGDRRDNNSPRK